MVVVIFIIVVTIIPKVRNVSLFFGPVYIFLIVQTGPIQLREMTIDIMKNFKIVEFKEPLKIF